MTRRLKIHFVENPEGGSFYSSRSFSDVIGWLIEMGQRDFILITNNPHGVLMTIGPKSQVPSNIASQSANP